ncbi:MULTISPECIES: alpha/beta fold hydrolase [unclassified Agromyces]|uniref:alpha/beta fold hydrolase n=1 Tax=unclassified Agromyces TaxID=2639701 RepID=UPI003014A220
MDLAMHSVTADDGCTVAYRVGAGEEPAVVVLHGLAGSGGEFVATAKALTGRKAVLIDQRGHGLSTRIPPSVTRDAFVRDVAAVIRASTSEPVHLVGHSMGAHTAMLVAAAHPELVRSLVLLEGAEGHGTVAEREALGDYFRSWPVPFRDRATAQEFLGDGPLQRAWIDDLEERADGLHPRFDPDVMVAILAEVAVPRWDEWARVEAPTLVVYAESGMFTEAQKSRFVERGRNVTRVDLDAGSHDAHLDTFDDWSAVLVDFVSSR